jgi:SAM-dependent methyltransferase
MTRSHFSSDAPKDVRPFDSAEIFERTAVHDVAAIARESDRVRIRDTLALIPEGVDSVLDVGCGQGKLLVRVLQRLGRRISERTDRPHTPRAKDGWKQRSQKEEATFAATGTQPATQHDTQRGAAIGSDKGAVMDAPLGWGTDLSWRSLLTARKQNLPVVRSSLFDLPYGDRSVDLVLCSEVLEHLAPQRLTAAVAELVRVARKHVLITVPYREFLLRHSRRCDRCGRIFHLHGHRRSFADEDLIALFPASVDVFVRHSWRIRPWSRFLLELRTHRFDLWKHTDHAVCPFCGNQELPSHKNRPLFRLFDALNAVVHPHRNKPRWLLVRADLHPPPASRRKQQR